MDRVIMIRRGREVRDAREVLVPSSWWVVAVQWSHLGLWAVYGGPADSVLSALAMHTGHDRITTSVAYPFADAATSITARMRFERKYARRSRRAVAALAS